VYSAVLFSVLGHPPSPFVAAIAGAAVAVTTAAVAATLLLLFY
jgi:hypothetical protein